MEIIVKEKSISDQMREFWELENLGINVDSENKDSMVEEIMRKFEEGISYKDKRYKVKLPWKPEMKNALHNNKEVTAEDSVRVTADIKQAFLQNRDTQETETIQDFFGPQILKTATQINFPHTHKLLENNLYVDDVHIGEENVDKALIVCLESYEIFKDASMYLRKWRTNSPELFHKLKERNLEVDYSPDFYNQTLVPSKVLGVAWNPKEDYFYFDIQSLEKFLLKSKDTKRYILVNCWSHLRSHYIGPLYYSYKMSNTKNMVFRFRLGRNCTK
ncbi:uncharacterized protein TNIN_128961 [Trichonephila inaurata madagascariensis]|uniref:Uncharacterized protein n=1 Tax=Trichonephila inaurata madagascariensis TaxID=2747483 RepID=A0A8X6YGA8_9ARAC|nr:uncharacterized protein TNIN_128961 [Trichonephila inaurata madagascariensis]